LVSVSSVPNAALYFEANGQLFTDGILHDRELLQDATVQ